MHDRFKRLNTSVVRVKELRMGRTCEGVEKLSDTETLICGFLFLGMAQRLYHRPRKLAIFFLVNPSNEMMKKDIYLRAGMI